jgi:hypothetical protein
MGRPGLFPGGTMPKNGRGRKACRANPACAGSTQRATIIPAADGINFV